MVAFSFNPIRKRYYEIFYYSHVVLIIGFLVTTALHFQYLAWWSYAALIMWAAERFVRLVVLTRVNRIGSGRENNTAQLKNGSSGFKVLKVEKTDGFVDPETWNDRRTGNYQGNRASDDTLVPPRNYYDYGPGQECAPFIPTTSQ